MITVIAAKIFSNRRYDHMETTLQFYFDDRRIYMPVVGSIAQLFLYLSERSKRF